MPLLSQCIAVMTEDEKEYFKVLGSTAKTNTKRGPMPVLARQMERIRAVPEARQKFLIEVLESMLA